MSAMPAGTGTAVATEVHEQHATPVQHKRNRWLWPLRWLLDRNDDPSSTKIGAYLILWSNYRGHPVETVTAVVVLSALFGYSMFKGTRDKTTLSAAATGAVNLAASLKHDVTEHTEKTFTYTKDGVPAQSLPLQGAKTPGGDD